ncbi:MAG: amino acid ABC transporter permease [Sphaerochaeta sp.]|nr:amino acid ABC transporter permease [Sphaerochaeta sp.]
MNRPFSPTFLFTVIPRLLPYLKVTFWVMGGTIFFGLIVGFLLAKAKLQGNVFSKTLAHGYTWALRCTPSIVLLFIVFYGLPKALLEIFGININSWHRGIFVVVTFSLLFAATFSEIMRSAFLAVEKGQYESAVSIGLSPFQAFQRIVFPQAVVVALPNLGNSFIILMKEGALAFTVGLVDVMGQGTLIISRNYGAYALETYLALALIYWLLTIALEKSFFFLEKRLSQGRKAWA